MIKYIFIICLILFILIINYKYKENYKNYIPNIIYKTGPFNKITNNEILKVFENNEEKLNGKIKYFNDKQRYNFIKTNFDKDVLKAYSMLIPGAYKADLWRLCVLYKNGGIYSDLTQQFLKNIDIHKEDYDLLFIRDRLTYGGDGGIANGFIVSKKNNLFLKYCINELTKQILNKDKGNTPLDITGPNAIKRHFCKYFNVDKIDLGTKKLKGLDNIKYIVSIPYYFSEEGEYFKDINNNNIVKGKLKNSHELLYSNFNKQNYHEDWHNNNIFRYIYINNL
tara:strand:- start:446 stop:1285 length:840 start_codon:yes stop_codon:yes gene_type:complete